MNSKDHGSTAKLLQNISFTDYRSFFTGYVYTGPASINHTESIDLSIDAKVKYDPLQAFSLTFDL